MFRARPIVSASDANLQQLAPRYISEYGYVVLKNVFTEEQALKFRRILDKEHEDFGSYIADLSSHEDLQYFIFSPEILSLVKAALGSKIVYFGLCSVNAFSESDEPTIWHNDNKGTLSDPEERIEEELVDNEWPVYRLAYYAQNHADYSGGLKVRDRSHKAFFRSWRNIGKALSSSHPYSIRSFPVSRLVNIPSTDRDLVIFNLRMHHSGNSKRLKIAPWLTLHTSLERYLFKNFPALFLKIEKPRRLVFVTYAKDVLKARAFMQNRGVTPALSRTFQRARYHLAPQRQKFDSVGINIDETPIIAEQDLERSRKLISEMPRDI